MEVMDGVVVGVTTLLLATFAEPFHTEVVVVVVVVVVMLSFVKKTLPPDQPADWTYPTS